MLDYALRKLIGVIPRCNINNCITRDCCIGEGGGRFKVCKLLKHAYNYNEESYKTVMTYTMPYNNNNNKVYTPLCERCSQSRVFISQCHMNHIIVNTLRVI